MTTARPLSVTVIAWLYILVGVVGFAYHVTELGGGPGWQTTTILVVRVMAVIVGAAMIRGARWARPAALAWMAYHVVLGALHSWGDVLMHLVLLGIFGLVLLRPAAEEYFRRAIRA